MGFGYGVNGDLESVLCLAFSPSGKRKTRIRKRNDNKVRGMC